ncbi:MAG: hypothetical protein ABS916_04655 [Carnobacterium sp.]|uniref:hypothetical protein n=1 Tax=Carnobacterium sp. TaxID=48221 RepID=UPI0033155799
MEGIDLFSILDEMKEKFNVEYEDEIQSYLSNPGNKNIYVVKGIKNEEFVTFIIYDCFSDTKFNYEKFFSVYESIEEAAIEIIMIFDDWKHEYDLYEECYKQEATNREKKIKLSGIFEQKKTYYAKAKETVKLLIKNEGINYLEYNFEGLSTPVSKDEDYLEDKHDRINGRIYNLQMSEIKKLYYVTGKDLFIKNVRLGIESKNIFAKGIKDSFKKYFQVYCYLNSKTNIQQTIAKNIWKLTHEIVQENLPRKFWYYHNGITFLIENGKDITSKDFEIIGSVINISPEKVSVINGAQTLTNIFYGIQEVLGELNGLIDNIDESISDKEKNATKLLFTGLIEESLKEIYVKSIFIKADSTLSESITNGLNTQIPILEEDSLAASKDILEINEALYERNIKVLKVGEKQGTKRGIDVLDLCKLYLTTIGQPGKSKNFLKSGMKNVIDDILDLIDKEKQVFLDDIETSLNISDWWPLRKKINTDKNEQEVNTKKGMDNEEKKYIIELYGKNYFQSYFLSTSTERGVVDEEVIIQSYTKFLNEFSKFDVNLGEFKKDDLFKLFKSNKETAMTVNQEIIIDSSTITALKKYLNEMIPNNSNQKSSINYLITKYFIDTEEKNDLKAFRTIPMIQKKNEKYVAKEAFPFSSNTFKVLYQGKDFLSVGESKPYNNYEDSAFKKAINETFILFVIYWDRDKKQINNIEYYPEFSFKDFDNEAETVYKKTIEAFEKGDYDLFPKTSEDLSFHIRTKAIDANDQFMFSNGEFITKRTFWANKDTIQKILSKQSDILFD